MRNQTQRCSMRPRPKPREPKTVVHRPRIKDRCSWPAACGPCHQTKCHVCVCVCVRVCGLIRRSSLGHLAYLPKPQRDTKRAMRHVQSRSLSLELSKRAHATSKLIHSSADTQCAHRLAMCACVCACMSLRAGDSSGGTGHVSQGIGVLYTHTYTHTHTYACYIHIHTYACPSFDRHLHVHVQKHMPHVAHCARGFSTNYVASWYAGRS